MSGRSSRERSQPARRYACAGVAVRPVPMAHAWHSWVDRSDGPHHALYFNWQEAVQARASYEAEIAGCLAQGWQIVNE